MEHWRLPYLGLRHIPSSLNEFELATFFTFSDAERALINARRRHLYRFALALHIGFLRMSGRTLDACRQVPRNLWLHLGEQLGLESPDLGSLYALYDGRADTLAEHQRCACKALGFTPITEHQRRYVVRWLKAAISGGHDRKGLKHELKRWLYEHRILLQRDRALNEFIVQATRDVEATLADALTQAFGDRPLNDWSKRLAEPHGESTSLQQWLWAVPLRHSTRQMGELFRKIEHLVKLGVRGPWPEVCNEAIVRQYALACAKRKPSVSHRVRPVLRRLEAACFLRYALCTATDQLLTMFGNWIRHAMQAADKRVAAQRPDLKAQLCDFAAAVKALAADTTLTRDALAEKLCTLADTTLKQKTPSRTSLMRVQLVTKRRMARAMLAKLLDLPFEAQTAHPVIDALTLLRTLYAKKAVELPPKTETALGRAWKRLIASDDRAEALVAFEWATLFALRRALRNGSVFVAHSFAHRSLAALLIPPDEWQRQRNHFYGLLDLPQDPKAYLKPITQHLEDGLKRLAEAVARGELRVDDAIHLEPLKAEPQSKAIESLRQALLAARPDGQLPEIILQIDSEVRFSWILLGREPRSRTELLLVYAAILAHGTSMSAADIARMVPELSAEAIRQMMRRIADERALRQAADAVLQFMHRHPITEHWGRADLASSDMMSLETARKVWQARADPRRCTRSISMYTHVRDRWGIFYDQPILLNRRQAGAAIEGVIRQQSTDDVTQIAVDTHGYTDFAMALARAFGFDLCPQLAHLRDRRLHVPMGSVVPDALKDVIDCDVKPEAVEAIWDEFVRVVASVYSGRCTAVQALARFGADARGQPLYDGVVHLGRLLRSIFLIDYFMSPAFRRELHRALNHGEAVHTVQRAIHQGKIPLELARSPHALVAVSSALTLLTNALMAWNTLHMQRALEAIEQQGKAVDFAALLRHIAPTGLEGINLRGTFDFPLAQYVARLMPSTTSAPTPSLAHFR